jgi:hypothetical protein
MTMIRNIVAYALFAVLQTLSAGAERVPAAKRPTPDLGCGAEASDFSNRPGFRAMRLIEDPGTHRRWLVERNVDHPAWPALLTAIEGDHSCCVCPGAQRETPKKRSGLQVSLPTIHAGDALVVVEDARAWHSEFEAVALSHGSPGDSIMVRLRIGGSVTLATVVSRGRVVAANKLEVYR